MQRQKLHRKNHSSRFLNGSTGTACGVGRESGMETSECSDHNDKLLLHVNRCGRYLSKHSSIISHNLDGLRSLGLLYSGAAFSRLTTSEILQENNPSRFLQGSTKTVCDTEREHMERSTRQFRSYGLSSLACGGVYYRLVDEYKNCVVGQSLITPLTVSRRRSLARLTPHGTEPTSGATIYGNFRGNVG